MEQAPYYDSRANWSGIPDYMRGAVERYVMHGVPPGSFLTAVFCNHFLDAVGQADNTNAQCLSAYARFLYNHVPGECKGSSTRVADWIKRGGVAGIQKREAAA